MGLKINLYLRSILNRINRILELPRGHALLVGVGGSGKQSLARLAASVAGFDVLQLQTRTGYGIPELKNDLSTVCLKAGLKKLPTVLLVTDAQLVDETLLGPIHDFLAAGEIPSLFNEEEIDNIVTSVRNEVSARYLRNIFQYLFVMYFLYFVPRIVSNFEFN